MSIADGNLTDLYNQYFGNAAQTPAAPVAAPSATGTAGDDALTAFNQEQIDSYREAMRNQLANQKRQLDFQYAQMKQQAKTAAAQLELQKWYQHQSIALLQKSAALERDKFGLSQQQFQFQKDSFGQQQGLDILKFQASLGGPSDYVASSNFAQGISGNPAYAGFVNSLTSGTNGRLFGAASGDSTPPTLGTLGSMYGASAGSTAADQLANGSNGDLAARAARAQSLVQGANKLAMAGGGSLAPQALQAMGKTNLGLLQSGFKGAGEDWDTFFQQARNAQIGNGQALAA